MQDTIILMAMAFGTALISASGASELAVALVVAAVLFVIALRSFTPRHDDADALHDSSADVRSQRS